MAIAEARTISGREHCLQLQYSPQIVQLKIRGASHYVTFCWAHLIVLVKPDSPKPKGKRVLQTAMVVIVARAKAPSGTTALVTFIT